MTIVSGDKDLIQLTDEHTVFEISKKGVAEFEAFTPDYLWKRWAYPSLSYRSQGPDGEINQISQASLRLVKRRVSASY